MSVIKDVYDGIKAAIAAKAPSVATFGLYNSQEQQPGNEGAYSFPAVFIRFQSNEDDEDTAGTSKGTMRIALHVQYNEFYNDDLPDFVFPVLDEVHTAVYGFSIPCAGPFRRKSTTQDDNHTNFQEWIVEYEGPFIDDSEGRAGYDQEHTLTSIRLAVEFDAPDGVSDPPSDIVVIFTP